MFRHLLDQHAGEAACLFPRREVACRSSSYSLADLAFVDERIDAHLDGLRLAGDDGWDACLDALDAAEEPEDLFAPAAIAAERDDPRAMGKVLDVTGGDRAALRVVAAALAWTSPAALGRVLDRLLAPRCPSVLQTLGIAVSAMHRRDPGDALLRALGSDDSLLAARALRAAGELGRTDLLPLLRQEIQGDRPLCRGWAAWSATLLGDAHALPALWQAAMEEGPLADKALMLVVHRSDPASTAQRLVELAASPTRARSAIQAMGALGDPGCFPWLLSVMPDPKGARLAGEAFALITGIDLVAHKLTGSPLTPAAPSDDPAVDDVAPDPDRLLPWPDPAAVGAAWEKRRASMPPGTRRLLGQPLGAEWLSRVRREGNQRARAIAAIALCLLAPGKPLFEVRAPGYRQLGG